MSPEIHGTVMRRRDFLRGVGIISGLALVPPPAGRATTRESDQAQDRPLEIGLGPQLFLDDYVLDRIEGLTRQVRQPQRLASPVLDSKSFGTTQPYLTVLRDRDRERFRIWYNHGPAVWHAESEDGIHWVEPRVAWALPRSYGASLIDDGDRATDLKRRYKLANWQATRGREDKTGDDGGMWLGFSPDGLDWTAHDDNPVLPTWPEGFGKRVRHGIGDTVDVYFDPLARAPARRSRFTPWRKTATYPAPKAGQAFRRLVGMSTSQDFLHWARPWRIFTPDDKDEGLLEFYGMGGMHQRGELYIGLVRVLRDDLPCDPKGPKDGIGYTVLATSRDGVTWQRYREPFLDRNPENGSWDHAMTWMSAALPVGDEVFFYYGGYARGHKIAPTTERQIGLARMKKDRYVALAPGREEGMLRTPSFVVPGNRLTVNADASRGEVRVRLLDQDGKPLKALGDAEARPITGDTLAAEVRWPKPLSALRGKPVCLEFRVRQAALFGFEFHA